MKELALYHFVYFIESSNGIKIGRTVNLQSRLSQINTGNHDKLNVLRLLQTTNKRVEKWFHAYFSKFHINGEWFSIEIISDIDNAIQRLSDEVSVRIMSQREIKKIIRQDKYYLRALEKSRYNRGETMTRYEMAIWILDKMKILQSEMFEWIKDEKNKIA